MEACSRIESRGNISFKAVLRSTTKPVISHQDRVQRSGICCSLPTCDETHVRQIYAEESESQREMIRTRSKTNQVGSPGDGNRNENAVNGCGAAGARQQYHGNKIPLMMARPVLERTVTSLPYFQVCFQRWVPRTAPTAVPGYGDVLYGHRGREAHLRAVFDVVSFVEAEVTKVVGRRPFAGSARLWGQG